MQYLGRVQDFPSAKIVWIGFHYLSIHQVNLPAENLTKFIQHLPARAPPRVRIRRERDQYVDIAVRAEVRSQDGPEQR
jgi:hypothetical protein